MLGIVGSSLIHTPEPGSTPIGTGTLNSFALATYSNAVGYGKVLPKLAKSSTSKGCCGTASGPDYSPPKPKCC